MSSLLIVVLILIPVVLGVGMRLLGANGSRSPGSALHICPHCGVHSMVEVQPPGGRPETGCLSCGEKL